MNCRLFDWELADVDEHCCVGEVNLPMPPAPGLLIHLDPEGDGDDAWLVRKSVLLANEPVRAEIAVSRVRIYRKSDPVRLRKRFA